MTEVTLLLSFRWVFPVNRMVVRESLGKVALEAHSKILLPGLMLTIKGHPGCGALGRHQKEDEDSHAYSHEDDRLDFFAHAFSVFPSTCRFIAWIVRKDITLRPSGQGGGVR